MFDVTPLHEALKKFLEREGIAGVWKIRGYKEEWEDIGYCDTCADRDFTLTIYYETVDDDEIREYVYGDELTTLIFRLTEDD